VRLSKPIPNTAFFSEFPKIARLNRDCVITEKIDGTNAQIAIDDDQTVKAGSRNRWITPDNDNHGFARWVYENTEELLKLGAGRHFGEWYGSGIQRGYGLQKGEKRFALFNVGRWHGLNVPKCCDIVPVLYRGLFKTSTVQDVIDDLRLNGSKAVPGFARPEGVVIFHEHARTLFKVTLEHDEQPKSLTMQTMGPVQG
jgi:hypothetical protein